MTSALGSRAAVSEATAQPERPCDHGATSCPVCGRRGRPFRSAGEIAQDLAQTAAHHRDRQLKLMRDEAVPVVACDACGTIWRDDRRVWQSAEEDYRHDSYDVGLLEQLFRDEVELAWNDRRWLQAHGVRPGCRLLEVACYVGGFLTFAAGQRAAAIGVDPNGQLVAWCRGRGLDACVGTVDQVDWHGQRFDGVWILNCFDQVAAPRLLLSTSRRVLRRGGHLVIRTPNAGFVRAAYGGPPSMRIAARQHALWGVPHLCCYTAGALSTLVVQAGFAVTGLRARPEDDGRASIRGGPPWFDLTAVAA